MPRAKPSRSGYCASRHLLRNLDDARELRRNPLVAGNFASSSRSRRRTPDEDRRALERICGLVREALGVLYAHAGDDRDGAHLGRMHAALLRCEIDRQPPELVAAELGLSERQLRRERSAAHEAFLAALRRVADAEHAPAPAPAAGARAPAIGGSDIAQLRLAEAVELHAVGKSSLGLAVFASIAATAPRTETRIEALCLAAEAELDAGRVDEASLLVAEANAVLALHGDEIDEVERKLFSEHIEFLEWSLRWQLGTGGGVAMRPPSIVTKTNDDAAAMRRALRVRALAAFAAQRWDVGDVPQGREAVRVARRLLPSLLGPRIKERLAVMQVEAELCALRGTVIDEGYPLLLALEQLAAHAGHLRPLITARAARLSTWIERSRPANRTFDDIFAEFATTERSSMRRTLAHVACIAVQWERDPRRAMQAADLADDLIPPGSTAALLLRSMRSQCAIRSRRHAEALPIAEAVRSDAARSGNPRLRGAAERDLAAIAVAHGHRRDARRLIRDAMPVLERYGSRIALDDASETARRVGMN